MDLSKKQKTDLSELQAGVNNYGEIRRIGMLKEQITALTIDIEGLDGEFSRCNNLLENEKNILNDYERQHRDIGGDEIERLEKEKHSLEIQRVGHLRKREQAAAACRELGWPLGDTPQGFAAPVGKAREEIDGLEARKNAARKELILQSGKKKETEGEFAKAVKEVRALESQPSNIPAAMLEMRQKIASSIGIAEAALRFLFWLTSETIRHCQTTLTIRIWEAGLFITKLDAPIRYRQKQFPAIQCFSN
ncbi:MAG: hypothetical protein FWG66_01595 [Spirochaetes bacterium]|nr:hypothetical protein [Spirochaetota bacterium]